MSATENKFLHDDEGNPSSMRLMSIISLLSAIGLAVLPVITDAASQDTVVLYFLTAAFAPKAIQKFAEQKK